MLKHLKATWLWNNKYHVLVMSLMLLPSAILFGYFSLITLALYCVSLWKWHKTFADTQIKIIYAMFAPWIIPILMGLPVGMVHYFFQEPRISVSAHNLSEKSLDPDYRLYGKPGNCLILDRIDFAMMFVMVGADLGSMMCSKILPGYHGTYQGPYPSLKQSIHLLESGHIYSYDDYIKDPDSLPLDMREETFKAILSYSEFPMMAYKENLVGYTPSQLQVSHESTLKTNAIKWAPCGQYCLVIRPIKLLSSKSTYIPDNSILLMDTKTSIVFARYKHDSDPVILNKLVPLN